MEPLTQTRIEEIAHLTVGQRDNPLWLEMRKARLTASNFGRVWTASQSGRANLDTLRSDITGGRDLSRIPAVKWGVDHEQKAIKTYEELTGYRVEETGIWLFPDGHMGASPDGLVRDREGVLVGILEVKCPWSVRNLPPETGLYKLPYIEHYPPALVKKHAYYHQVQGELAATNLPWCDFFVWTPRKTLTVRVYPDETWKTTTLPSIKSLYLDKVRLPEAESSTVNSARLNAQECQEALTEYGSLHLRNKNF